MNLENLVDLKDVEAKLENLRKELEETRKEINDNFLNISSLYSRRRNTFDYHDIDSSVEFEYSNSIPEGCVTLKQLAYMYGNNVKFFASWLAGKGIIYKPVEGKNNKWALSPDFSDCGGYYKNYVNRKDINNTNWNYWLIYFNNVGKKVISKAYNSDFCSKSKKQLDKIF